MADVLMCGKMLSHAPLGIAVCAEVARSESLWVHDASAATENVLIAANALGLAVYPPQDRVAAMVRVLGMPPGILALCVVAVGHPAETRPTGDRYHEARVHSEVW